MPCSDVRLFTEDWTISLSSHPHLKFVRSTPLNWEDKRKVLAIDNFQNDRQNWGEEEWLEAKKGAKKRYNDGLTKLNGLEVLAQIDGKFVGHGGCYQIDLPIPERLANVGLGLAPEARGKGVGKALMQVLLRLSNELDVDVVHAGTLKINTPMRALAKSLGLEETERVLEIPGRGIVADILYDNIHTERWLDVDIIIDFKGPAPQWV